MAKFDPKAIRDASDIPARLKELEAKVKSLETSSGLDSASFSGTLRVAPGGEFVVDGGSDIILNGGGAIQGRDGSGITFRHPGNVVPSFWAGTVGGEGGTAHGLSAFTKDWRWLFGAYQSDAAHYVLIGDANEPVNRFWAHADRIDLNTYATDSNGWIYLNPASKQVAVNIDSGSGTAVHINEFGRLYRLSSSSRYKQDIEDAGVEADSVLQLRARQWRYKQQVADPEVVAPTAFGFIAEEVDETGLAAAVTRNADGEPDGLDYNAILAATVELCKRQQAEIDELRSRIAAMETGQNTSL